MKRVVVLLMLCLFALGSKNVLADAKPYQGILNYNMPYKVSYIDKVGIASPNLLLMYYDESTHSLIVENLDSVTGKAISTVNLSDLLDQYKDQDGNSYKRLRYTRAFDLHQVDNLHHPIIAIQDVDPVKHTPRNNVVICYLTGENQFPTPPMLLKNDEQLKKTDKYSFGIQTIDFLSSSTLVMNMPVIEQGNGKETPYTYMSTVTIKHESSICNRVRGEDEPPWWKDRYFWRMVKKLPADIRLAAESVIYQRTTLTGTLLSNPVTVTGNIDVEGYPIRLVRICALMRASLKQIFLRRPPTFSSSKKDKEKFEAFDITNPSNIEKLCSVTPVEAKDKACFEYFGLQRDEDAPEWYLFSKFYAEPVEGGQTYKITKRILYMYKVNWALTHGDFFYPKTSSISRVSTIDGKKHFNTYSILLGENSMTFIVGTDGKWQMGKIPLQEPAAVFMKPMIKRVYAGRGLTKYGGGIYIVTYLAKDLTVCHFNIKIPASQTNDFIVDGNEIIKLKKLGVGGPDVYENPVEPLKS